MKRTIGYFTLLAAVVLIVCSASTLFLSAYDGAIDPVQKWIQGTQIVAAIIWEAGAVIAVTYCFTHGYKLIGWAGVILLILAMGYTLSEELRQQAGTQENVMAKRTAENGKLELVRSELDKAIKRRDDLQTLRKPTYAQQDELATVRREISKLKDKWEAQIETPHAVVAPGVALIARWTKLNVTDSADLNPLIKMAFWTMARVFALPIAVFGISLLGATTLPVQGRIAPEAPTLSKMEIKLPRAHLEPRNVHAIMAGTPGTGGGGIKSSPGEGGGWIVPSDEPPTPPADAKPVEEPDHFRDITEKVTSAPAKPVLVTEDWQPAPPVSKKERKRMLRERLKDDAVKAVEEFAATMLDLESARARFVRSPKGFVESGGMSGTELGKHFRQWAGATKKWRHFGTYNQIPLGKAMSAVIEAGRPTNGGGAVYAALLRKEPAAIAA